MLAYYGSQISPHLVDTPEGFLICKDVPIARTGEQEYLARELMLDGDPERPVTVQRRPEDVFAPAALASFEGKPVTDGHPPESVGAENYAAYAKGHVQNVRRQGDYVTADLYINDAALADEVRNRVKREVSCGYLCDYVPEGAGYRQERIRGNHVAVVPKGRAGAAVAIQDAAPEAEKGRNNIMSYWKTFLAAFAGAARDAEPGELDRVVETTAAALDAEPAEKAQEAAPAKEEEAPAEEALPAEDTLDARLGRLEAMLARLMPREEEPHMADETDLDEAIARLAGEKEEEGGSALTVPLEEDACSPARDAAVELLKKVRPAVAAIEDKAQRARVTDALLSAIQGPDALPGIAKAALDSASAAAKKTGRASYEQICADSESAYASRNPHNKKEG